MKTVPQSCDRVAILRTGQARLVRNLPPREHDSLRGQDGVTVAGADGTRNLFVHVNSAPPSFDDPRIRRAVAHSIPTDAIVRVGHFGQATPWKGHVPSRCPGCHEAERRYPLRPRGGEGAARRGRPSRRRGSRAVRSGLPPLLRRREGDDPRAHRQRTACPVAPAPLTGCRDAYYASFALDPGAKRRVTAQFRRSARSASTRRAGGGSSATPRPFAVLGAYRPPSVPHGGGWRPGPPAGAGRASALFGRAPASFGARPPA